MFKLPSWLKKKLYHVHCSISLLINSICATPHVYVCTHTHTYLQKGKQSATKATIPKGLAVSKVRYIITLLVLCDPFSCAYVCGWQNWCIKLPVTVHNLYLNCTIAHTSSGSCTCTSTYSMCMCVQVYMCMCVCCVHVCVCVCVCVVCVCVVWVCVRC